MSASTVKPPVWSGDPDAEQVAALVARGMDQWEASVLVYGSAPVLPDPPIWDAPAPVWSVWVARYVHAVFAPLRRVVGLS